MKKENFIKGTKIKATEQNTADRGEVILIGAGCGRGLITLEGYRELQKAEAVVYDELIDKELLKAPSWRCELINVGKRSGRHSMSQSEINEILIREAMKGKRVVRLKGGDSFVFGRGGEEVETLKEQGISFKVIPGVSSAIAVPENAGIPVTHRLTAQSFTVVTGHTAADVSEDYEALAKLKGTLVFLMGIGRLSDITEKLMAFGKSADTPAAVISKGFTSEEKRINGRLKDIAELAADAETPGILVVGTTAAIDFSCEFKRPLYAKRMLLTGTESFASKLSELFAEKGAYCTAQASMRIVPRPERIPEELSGYGWLVFTSANGVRVFFESLKKRKTDIRKLNELKFACIGSGTKAELERHLIYPELVPEKYTALELGKLLGKVLTENAGEERVLILRASNGSKLLNEELDKCRVYYDDVHIYDTESDVESSDMHYAGLEHAELRYDYVVFGSAGGVKSIFDGADMGDKAAFYKKAAADAKAVCIGEYTAEEYVRHTGKTPIVAEVCSAEGIVEAVVADASAIRTINPTSVNI